MKVREIMSTPVITCGEDTTVDKAANLLKEYKIGAVVITKDDVPIGIATGTGHGDKCTGRG